MTMRNITSDIKKAIQINVVWSVDEFYLFLETARINNFDISYWDDEETWATLLLDSVMVGYVYRKFPLVLLSVNDKDDVRNLLSAFEYIAPICVSDLASAELIIDGDPVIVDRFGWLEYGQPLSATDIWFYTIT